jgi:hypothetical protein
MLTSKQLLTNSESDSIRMSTRSSQALARLAVVTLLWIATACGSGPAHFMQGAPGFTLTAVPGNLSVDPGGSGTSRITITPQNGFNAAVDLAVSGLPSGVSASFNPTSTTSTSILTFTATPGASTGMGAITVTGTSGSIAPQNATISLTVAVPPPPGSVPTSFFALNNVEPSDDPAFDGMSYGAIGHPIRLAWPYIEGTRGQFDFSFYDQYANSAPTDQNGVALFDLTLGMTPGWAVANQSSCRQIPQTGTKGCQAPPDNLQDWKDFITALIHHYNGSTAPHIKYYEIWNEWNFTDPDNGFWSGTTQQLVTLAQAAYPIIHQDPFSLVVTPSTVGPATTAGDSAPKQLANYLQLGGAAAADAASFHGNVAQRTVFPFPLPGEPCSDPDCNGTIVQIANSYRQVMDANGMPNKPLLDSEGGFEDANIVDVDQRAAWLAQFYALQGGLFNPDQLVWVSWFTWGAPGVAGNIETANRTPNPAGVAYSQLSDWLVGRFPQSCSQNGKLWTCPLTGAASYQAEILWDDSKTCSGGNCTTAPQPVSGNFVKYRDLTGKSTVINNGTVPVGLKPIIIENQ